MLPINLSVATRCFRLPFLESFRAAADAGAQGVQLDARDELPPGEWTETGRRQLLHRLTERGLSIAALTFPTRRSFYDEDQLDARVAMTRRVMEFAWQLKCPVVTLRVGKIPADKEGKPYRILRDVWRSTPDWQDLSTVTEHVRRLRQQLEADPAKPTRILTVRGRGYRWAG